MTQQQNKIQSINDFFELYHSILNQVSFQIEYSTDLIQIKTANELSILFLKKLDEDREVKAILNEIFLKITNNPNHHFQTCIHLLSDFLINKEFTKKVIERKNNLSENFRFLANGVSITAITVSLYWIIMHQTTYFDAFIMGTLILMTHIVFLYLLSVSLNYIRSKDHFISIQKTHLEQYNIYHVDHSNLKFFTVNQECVDLETLVEKQYASFNNKL